MRSAALLFLVFLMPLPAQASSFMQCKVEAGVLKADSASGVYSIKVLDSITTGGQAGPGQPCIMAGHEMEIELKDKLPEQGAVTLYYEYSDGMGPDGVVVNKSWSTKNPREDSE